MWGAAPRHPFSQCDDLQSILVLSIFCAVDLLFLIPTNCTYSNKYTLCHFIEYVFWLYLVIFKENSVTKEYVAVDTYIRLSNMKHE
jgi:hypothetical protein